MRSNGTAAELEARRVAAVRRVNDGWAQKGVAEFLGVRPVTVAKWVARHRARGDEGLRAKPTPGRPRFLAPDQERKVLGWVAEPPTRHGFATDLWTARRVIVSADNGREASRTLQADPGVEIVLMDIMMPEMDGMETMREIRKIPQLKNLPIVAVTAKAMKGDREKCIEAGAWDYLSKPVDAEQLLAVLRAWLHR
jgi:CheY-like chemotaxis protein